MASLARQIESYADADSRDLSSVESHRRFAAHILEVLNARATIDAADRQRKGTERLARATTAAAKVQEETANRTQIGKKCLALPHLGLAAFVALDRDLDLWR